MSFEKEFIPEVTINNSKEKKLVEIDGVETEVELPVKVGFNIKTKNKNGEYVKEYFKENIDCVILFDKYQIQSKYKEDISYISSEFNSFMPGENYMDVFDMKNKGVLVSGEYPTVKAFFTTKQATDENRAEKSFDVFSILYFLLDGQVYRFKWKMGMNNNWFSYKDGCKVNKEDRNDTKDYRGVKTKFALEKKTVGTNTFYVCQLQNIGKVNKEEIDAFCETLDINKNNNAGKALDIEF